MERRYHLRYYKTATCVHETDTRGYCVKNGPHCAFAHGPLDLRQPVYDIRELQAIEKEETEVGQTGIENNKAVLEDPRWQGLCSTVRFSNVHKWYLHLHFPCDLFCSRKVYSFSHFAPLYILKVVNKFNLLRLMMRPRN